MNKTLPAAGTVAGAADAAGDDDLNQYKYANLATPWGAARVEDEHRGQRRGRRRRREEEERHEEQVPTSRRDDLHGSFRVYSSTSWTTNAMLVDGRERLATRRRRLSLALVFVRHAVPKLALCVFLINAAAGAAAAASAAFATAADVYEAQVRAEEAFTIAGNYFTRPTGLTFVDTYLNAWWLFLAFEGVMELVSAAQIMFLGGVLPAQAFFKPMTRSASLREFWSQRWNYPAKSALKRLAYDPARYHASPLIFIVIMRRRCLV